MRYKTLAKKEGSGSRPKKFNFDDPSENLRTLKAYPELVSFQFIEKESEHGAYLLGPCMTSPDVSSPFRTYIPKWKEELLLFELEPSPTISFIHDSRPFKSWHTPDSR